MTFSDAQLQDYLAGRADADLASALEEAVTADPALEARLMSMDPFAGAVQDAFAHLPGADRLARLESAFAATPDHQDGKPMPGEKPVGQRVSGALGIGWPAAVAAVIAVAAVLGFGAATLLGGAKQDLGWKERVAIYQALYVPQTVASIETTDAGLAAQFERAGTVLSRTLEPALASDVPGLTLKRAQVLAHDGAPIIQIAYAAGDGAPIAFCIIRSGSAGTAPDPQFIELAGLPVAHWAGNGFGYMLIGDLAPADMQAAAARLHAAFPPV